MNQSSHRDYYIGRAESARRLARNAASPGIAAIHREMAKRYEGLARETDQPTIRSEPRSHVSA